jgi:pyridoxal phosphate enzyme (YggS family)
MSTYEEFCCRVAETEARIEAAARAVGREPRTVRLLPVTKTHPAEAAAYAARRGLGAVGENRVQEAAAKRPATAALLASAAGGSEGAGAGAAVAPPRWELIGHLQSNKARLAAETFDRIQSVDTDKLVRHLDRAAGELGRPLAVLLQVNSGRDPAKFGCELEDAPRLLEAALAAAHLRVEGLMAIAPLGATPEETAEHARRTFAALRELRDTLAARFGRPLPELSMGMSGDLELAVAAGSTCVRVGTALYGAR